MTQVVVDPGTQAKLSALNESVDLCDTSGKILGRFIPASRREPQISEEEIRRREQSTEKRYTTAEVLAHLEKL